MPPHLRAATRRSSLALAQVEEVRRLLGDMDVVPVETSGDQSVRSHPGAFVKEVDDALMRGAADVAVHSMKDLPLRLRNGLVLACVPPRASPYDVLVPAVDLSAIPEGWRVGTSSRRRGEQLRMYARDVRVVPIRGNVDSRLRKVGNGVDAVMLAEAGLNRLGIHEGYTRLPPHIITPAAGQGALAILVREDDTDTRRALRGLDDPDSRFEVVLERGVVGALGADCRAGPGVLARMDRDGGCIDIQMYFQGSHARLRERLTGITDAEVLAGRVVDALLKRWIP